MTQSIGHLVVTSADIQIDTSDTKKRIYFSEFYVRNP